MLYALILYTLAACIGAKRVVVREWSMSPTLIPDEYVLVNRLAYRVEEPRRGDIVLARHPQQPQMLLIKRVAALPGDTVAWDAQGVWVNGGLCGKAGLEGQPPRAEQTWDLAPGHYFLLGDALDLSTDSRHFGPVLRAGLVGKAWWVYWPRERWRTL